MLPELFGKRIVLRPPKASDLIAFFYYASKPNIGPSAGWMPHQNLDESKNRLDLFMREEKVFAITLKTHDVMIGSIGFHEIQNDTKHGQGSEIGFVLDDTYWNQGIMTEAVQLVIAYAFRVLKFDYLMVSHAHFNLASKRVIEKAGFSFQFKKDKHMIENTHLTELWYYKLTKEDYFSDEKGLIN